VLFLKEKHLALVGRDISAGYGMLTEADCYCISYFKVFRENYNVI
jgi:hypothetical protein